MENGSDSSPPGNCRAEFSGRFNSLVALVIVLDFTDATLVNGTIGTSEIRNNFLLLEPTRGKHCLDDSNLPVSKLRLSIGNGRLT